MSSTILLVEDDRALLLSYALVLQNGGFQVQTASSVREARELLQRMPFDLCVLDNLLPDGTGSELARELLFSQPKLKVVLVSAFRRHIEHGAVLRECPNICKVLLKPLEPPRFLRAVEDAIEGRSPTESAAQTETPGNVVPFPMRPSPAGQELTPEPRQTTPLIRAESWRMAPIERVRVKPPHRFWSSVFRLFKRDDGESPPAS